MCGIWVTISRIKAVGDVTDTPTVVHLSNGPLLFLKLDVLFLGEKKSILKKKKNCNMNGWGNHINNSEKNRRGCLSMDPIFLLLSKILNNIYYLSISSISYFLDLFSYHIHNDILIHLYLI